MAGLEIVTFKYRTSDGLMTVICIHRCIWEHVSERIHGEGQRALHLLVSHQLYDLPPE